MALITKEPAWAISNDDAQKLAVSIKNVAQYHSVSVDPKYMAYGQLALTAGAIYVPRALIINAKKSQAKKEAQQAQVMQAPSPVAGDFSQTVAPVGKMRFQ